MFTDHSFFAAYYEECARVLQGVIQAVPQDPLEVEVWSCANNYKPVTVPYRYLNPLSLGKFDILGSAKWGPAEGVRRGKAELRIINGNGLYFKTFKTHPGPQTCFVGPSHTVFWADDATDMPYLRVARESDLEELLICLVQE